MPELSFACEPADVAALDAWAERLGASRSDLIEDAVHSYLGELDREHALVGVASWGPMEDWSDWTEPGEGR